MFKNRKKIIDSKDNSKLRPRLISKGLGIDPDAINYRLLTGKPVTSYLDDADKEFYAICLDKKGNKNDSLFPCIIL
jgi:hypothetical protein